MRYKSSCIWLSCLVVFSHGFAEETSSPQVVQPQNPVHPNIVQQPIPSPSATPTTPPVITPYISNKVAGEKPFKPFTGKVKAKKVRLRAQADREAHIISELNRNDLLSVVDETNEFYAIIPPPGIKAFVFRSLILDNVVEGNRVNVRLAPDLEAPIIGHLNTGEHVDPVISAANSKWYEIDVPAETKFFVAKEYIENVGGPELKAQLDKRKAAVEQLLDAALLLSKAELRKSYEEINIDRIKRGFTTVIDDYTDFPEFIERAKEAYVASQESYLQKKISFLEDKASTIAASEEIKGEEPFEEEIKEELVAVQEPSDRMKMWQPIEEALYLTWNRMNEELTLNDFYEEQQLNAVTVTGILEPYTTPVRNKPGDFVLRDKDLPIAYLYSTHCNLQSFVGKKITVVASPRENNHFAFPAYYVHDIR